VTGFACLGGFWIAMTPAAGNRVHPANDPVPCKVVAAMWCAAMGSHGIPARRFEFNTSPMAGITIAWLVAHGTYIAALISHQSVVICKNRCMGKSSEGKILVSFIVTIQTKPQILTIFLGMSDG